MTDEITEAILGTSSIAVIAGHAILAQVSVHQLDGLLSVITSVGGPGLAVWLVYYHTTVTIPNAQKEFRAERAELLAEYTKQVNERRDIFQSQIQELLTDHKEEMGRIVEKSYCKYQTGAR